MKSNRIAGIIMAAFLCGAAIAQTAARSATSDSDKIAPGVVIPVELTKTVDAKKAKTGDEVFATVTQDLKTSAGEVVLPKDTKVVGHVTEAQARSKEQKESQLAILFDHAILKTGDMALRTSIQAVVAPQNDVDNGNSAAAAPPGPGSVGTTQTSPMSGRSPVSTPMPTAPSPGDTGTHPANGGRPEIHANTQGVIGIPNLKLESAPNADGASVLVSEKSNVKMEGGTFMLLRVAP